jgi:2-amino-4-hydroxy-6-hydroxymethyldihydropteridine diphosphokinase
MGRVFVALGSNIGDRLGFLQKAMDALGSARGFKVRRVSSVYETEPVGKKDQPQFLNAAVELHSLMSPQDVLVTLKQIERAVGRTPSERWGPREIDLDLIYVQDLVIDRPELVLPHPEVASRRFVLTPLAEIAPEFVDPLRKRSLRKLLSSCPDPSSVIKISSTIHTSAVEN